MPLKVTSAFEQYLELRERFAVSRELAVRTLDWAEPLARNALGAHAQRDMLGLGESLQLIPVLTTPEDNGGWGELMPVWFKPYERPLPVYILDNWALVALLYRHWLGEVGPEFKVENLLRVFVGGDILIPFLPATQRGGQFLRHGALTVLLGTLWLDPSAREAFVQWNAAGARRFAEARSLREQADPGEFMGSVEFEALMLAEVGKIGGEAKVRAFLADETRFDMYAGLFGGLCFSLAALYDWYGPDWQAWIFQAVNVHYRYADFGIEAWEKWLGK